MVRRTVPQKTLAERLLDAEVRASQWLADGNEARDTGLDQRADECYKKAQFWLDRLNLLSGRSDRAAPKE
jgi:hypothetical protein